MTFPITYSTLNAETNAKYFDSLKNAIKWEHRDAPRREAFFSDKGEPYTYGAGRGVRTYYPQEFPIPVRLMQRTAEFHVNCRLEACFANYYLNQSDHLGWHADDSDVIDMSRPIVVMSFGVEREIWFRANDEPEKIEKLLLNNGSILVMNAGMQLTHQHRIPKCDRHCGERISLTFRGLI